MASILDSVPDKPPCDSEIWGAGKLIDTVQRARLFSDSKAFVDLKLLHSEELVISNFKSLSESPSKEELEAFVKENFSLHHEQEFDVWKPTDWKETPQFLRGITETPLRHVGLEVNKLWKMLSRKCSEDLKANPDKYSKVFLPHGFIMPGGRFREIYYWDTYWIVRGLLLSGMYDTVKGIMENFFFQVSEFGYIPNGTRKYYTRRSQPPYLTSMMSKYVEATEDMMFLENHMDLMEKELDFYEKNRCLKYAHGGKEYYVYRYFADCRGPRPESYAEDVEVAEELFEDEAGREEFYLHMKAAAESGWDFSSRWFIDEHKGNAGKLSDAKTSYIVPVDLNALMYKNYRLMEEFHSQLGQEDKCALYGKKAKNVLRTISELLWDPHEKMWFDWDMLNHCRRRFFYASNLVPLWAEAYPEHQRKKVGKCAVLYLLRTGVTSHEGGIPASLYHTSQQWDWNVWPPSQHMIVSGLNKTGNIHAQRLAFRIARNYTLVTMTSCRRGQACMIFEKYNPVVRGEAGGGGEYEVQLGFGWTNGVLIDFIATYGDDLLQYEEFQSREMKHVYGFKAKLRRARAITEEEAVEESPVQGTAEQEAIVAAAGQTVATAQNVAAT